MATETLELPCGDKIPMLGYGTGTVWMKSAEDDVDRATVDAIKEGIDLGYRHLDGAQCITPVSPSSLCRESTNPVEQDYETEPELGLAIEESKVPRAEFFVTTKAVSPIDVEGTLVTSLKKMRMEYVDLYLIHEPFSSGGSEEVLQEAWRGMERCREKGLARSIGVSNFLIPHLESILKVATVKPAVNQIECHPYLQRSKLREFMKRQGIIAEAFAPLTPITKASPGPIDAMDH
uniref:NADP-dependent oxidoreductase domain-containing protein n=1 Tax=Bionectria ochroleuca TaxID=29856 RepID=A0A8H7TKM3_BIOOC